MCRRRLVDLVHHDREPAAVRRRRPPAAATSDVDVADGEIPEETAGPYPGDGTNGPNVLAESGVVRSDITTSFGDASGVAEGVPVTVKLKVYDLNGDDATPLAGAAVYLWHCDRGGNYSMYDGDAVSENYLRGVQEAADDGTLPFTTIFPACYAGRWPHMHFEVYESLDAATNGSRQAAHLAARPAAGRLRDGLRDRGLRAVGAATWPRSASTPTASSPTGTPCRWPSSPARSRRGTSRR